jgi:acyl carrier protein
MQTSQRGIIMQVRRFVQESFLYVYSDFHLADDDRLRENGVIDSMIIVEMISFIEREFGVNAREEDISDANCLSLAGTARFVSERQFVVAA